MRHGTLIICMEYDYNRRAFQSVLNATNVDPLAAAYCLCVLLELSLKQHLNLCTSPSNAGHDLPQLLQRVGLKQPLHRTTCNALGPQLSALLARLHCQSKDGTARLVPQNSYPYLRYLRHSSDWETQSSEDADLKSLLAHLKRVSFFLKVSVGAKA